MTWHNLKGFVNYAQVYEPDDFMGDRRWKLNWTPFDDREWAKFEAIGLGITPKEDNEGRKFVTFRRPVSKLFPRDDERTYFTPPKITGAVNVSYVNEDTNEELQSYMKSSGVKIKTVGDQILIGNGSVCIVGITSYNAKETKGHRLMNLNVLDLVEFNPEGPKSQTGLTQTEKKIAEEQGSVAKTEAKKDKKSGNTTVHEDMNDSVPW